MTEARPLQRLLPTATLPLTDESLVKPSILRAASDDLLNYGSSAMRRLDRAAP